MDDATLTVRLCELLGEVPGWSWRPEGAYTSGETGVFYGAIGPDPDRAVGVRVYGTTDDRVDHLGWRRVQLRFRGARGRPDGADALASAAFTRLQGLSRTGGISDISRLSMAPSGADSSGREERTDNYVVVLDNTEAQA